MAARSAMHTVAEKPAADVAQLEAFTGRWHAEGRVYASAYGEAARWVSEERYEWLPGGHFLVNRWDARVGQRDFEGLTVLGRDPAGGWFAAFYDNGGNAPRYRVSVEGSVWTFSGDEQRAFYEMSPGAMKIHWEWRDGAHWKPLCDLAAERARGAGELVLDLFDAFEAQDRDAAERLLADDFRFTSPRDEPLDRREYMERCWPASSRVRAFRIERLAENPAEDGERGAREVFVRYSAERVADGVRFRNTEHFRVSRGRIRKVDVYFGRDL